MTLRCMIWKILERLTANPGIGLSHACDAIEALLQADTVYCAIRDKVRAATIEECRDALRPEFPEAVEALRRRVGP